MIVERNKRKLNTENFCIDQNVLEGENDIEAAHLAGGSSGSGADILRRLVCAVASRGVTPAGTDGSGPPAAPRHDPDPQLSTAAHTDMLLLNLMRINGLTPKHSRHVDGLRSITVTVSVRLYAQAAASGSGAVVRLAPTAAGAPRAVAPRPAGGRAPARAPPPRPPRPASAARPRCRPDSCDIGTLGTQPRDTLFDMLLNSLAIDGGAGEALGAEARPATPPVQPWSPAQPPDRAD
ncbi:hypothetical protein HF086_009054 [Spodoptera exigua]|uniref:Uncharacterized protein n=1 Tax=Spodoptera exigua TaxID=7107 RepID=A0A922MKQ3_SPOEX|nr:hypothetical protein HF086_009054 [Spodoptera exigua]